LLLRLLLLLLLLLAVTSWLQCPASGWLLLPLGVACIGLVSGSSATGSLVSLVQLVGLVSLVQLVGLESLAQLVGLVSLVGLVQPIWSRWFKVTHTLFGGM
jgi:hypothetical protein